MVALLYGPLVLLTLYSFVAFVVIISKLCYLNTKDVALSRKGLREVVPLLVYPVLYNIICSVSVANRFYDAYEREYYPLWLAQAVADPAQSFFLPLGFLLHPYTLKRLFCGCKKKPHDSSITAFVVSEGSLDVEPLIIKGSDSKSVPSYQSIFEGRES